MARAKRYCKLCHYVLPKTKRRDALFCNRRCKEYYSKGHRDITPGTLKQPNSLVFKGSVQEYVDFLNRFYEKRKAYYCDA